MNKTTTRLLLLSFLVFFSLLLNGQQQSVLPIEKSQAPGYAELVCPNDQGQTVATITIPEGYEIEGEYYFLNDQGGWTCFFCGVIEPSITFQIPRNGKVFSVKAQCSYDSNGDGIKEPVELGWSFYGPLESFPNATPHPETSCNSQDGSITVTDLSLNPFAMPREYILYNSQGSLVASQNTQSNTYTFNNLAAGNYTVRLSNGCTYNETTTTVGGPTNPAAKIDGPTSLCLGTGTELVATGGESYLWSTGATSSSITVLPSTPGLHTYSVQVKKGTCSQNAELKITVTPGPTASILGPDKACYNGSVILTASGTGTYKWSTGASTSSINLSLLQSSQTYGLTITDPVTKCSSVDEHVVNVLPKPTLNDTPNSICAGASVNLSVSGGSSYSWNVGGTTASIVHSPSEFTEYRVTVTDANGCVYSLSKSVNVEALPRITFGGGTSICAGQSLNVTAIGGQSYLWSHNNATTATITVSPTQNTTYTVTATSVGGCTSSAQRVISVKPSPAGNIDAPGSICPGQSVTLVATGGSTYRWTEGNATTASITVSPTQNTNYTVSITNTEGCTVVKSHSIAVNISGLASNDGPLTCSKTTVTLLGSSSAQGATFRWKNASGVEIANTPSTKVNTPGVYTLEISAAGGCSFSTATEVLLDRQVPIVSASNAGVITCAQPSISLLGSSSLSPASYEWRNASGVLLANTLNASTTQAGTYTLKVTAANGCSGTASTTVSADVATPQVNIQHDGPLTCTKTSVTLNAISSTPNLQYTWRNSGGSIIASNSASVVVTATGTYQLEARGSNGCTSSTSATITQSGNFPNISVNNPGSISCVGPEATISGSSTTPGVTYAWYNPNGKLMTTQQSFIANIAGTYTLKVTSAEGCVSSASTTLSETVLGAQAITLRVGSTYTDNSFAQGELTCTQNSVSMSASARFAGYSISVYWTNAAGQVVSTYNSLTVSSPGYYYLRQNGCPLVKEILIKENRPAPVVEIGGEKLACVGKSTTLTASGGGQYNWSSGATSSTMTTDFIYSPTTYTVTVSTGTYCSTVANVTVSNYPSMSINIAGETSLCAGTFVTLTASGGYTYKWSHNNATTESINVAPLVPSTYTVTATSDKGCTAVKTHVISTVKSQPNDFNLNGLPTSAFCGEAPLNINVVNPISTYTWKWSTGETTTSIQSTLTSSQTISVTATRNNGCTRTKAIPITVNTKPAGLIQGAEINCAGGSTILTAPLGESYLWSTNASTSSISIQAASDQTYRVTVSNAGGTCSASFERRVSVPAALNLSHDLTGKDDCIPNNAAVIPIVSGGTGSITLGLIRNGELYVSPNLDGLTSGTYLLRAEDTRGCLALREVVIQETPLSVKILNLQNPNDCIAGNVQLKLGAQNGRGPVEIRLNPNANPDTLFTLASGTYKAVAVDSLGCRDSLSIVIDERLSKDLHAYQRNTEDCDPNNTAIAAYGQSARGALSFQLDNGVAQTDSLFSNVAPGAHRLYFIDSLGCRDSFYILVANEAQLQPDVQGVSRCDTADAVLSIYASPSNAATQYQYSIDAGQNWQNSSEFRALPPGLYIPALKKLPAGCIITGDTLVISDTCRSYALAGFTKDTVMITQPDQLVIFPWLVETPRWMQDDFNLKLVLQGTGEPHFVEYNPDGTNSNLRSERLFAQRQYLNGFNGPDKDSTALASTARLFDYPKEYTFTLQSVTPSKLKIDPKRKDLRVIVVFDPETYTEKTVIICKGESTTLDARPGSCFNWNDGSTENPRTVSPTEDTEYSVTVLDDQLQARIIRYKVIVLDVDPEITVETDPDELCEDGPIKLKASPVGAQYTYLWNTGATTAEISVSSSSLLNLYRVTVTESREDSEGNVKTCSAVAEMGKEEILAAVQSEKWNAVFDKLVELGFKPYPCRLIKAPAFRATPELRGACTGVEDNSTVTEIEWDATIVDLKQRVCDDVADANTAGFGARGYLFDGICNPSFQQIMSDVRTDPHNMDQVIVYLDRKDSDDDVFFQYFEEYDKFLEETVFIEEYELRGNDCKGTLRLNTSGATLNSWQSWIVQSDFVRNLHPTTGVGEFQIPKASSKNLSNAGYADLAIPWTGEIFEVKSGETSQIATTAEKKQLNNYVEKAIEYCKPTLWRAGLFPSYPYPFAFPRYLPHVDPNKVLQAWWAEAGIIKYREIGRNGPQINVPLPPPLPPVDFPEATKKRIRKHFQDTQLIQDEKEKEHVMKKFLRDNPEIYFYLLTRTVDVKAAIVAGGIAVIVVVIADDLAGIVVDDAAGIAFAMKLFQIAASL